MTENTQFWRKCSSCKKPIPYGAVYCACSVSTCNRKRSSLVFCSIPCWDAHLPIMNHREASAVERTAPTRQEAAEIVAKGGSASDAGAGAGGRKREILVIASKVKDYIRSQSGMNTSAGALEILSDKLREISDEAIKNARTDGRQTVLDRDVGGRKPKGESKQIIRRRPDSAS